MTNQVLLLSSIKKYYLIIIIFLIGLGLRLYDLGTESMWYDETVSVAVAKLGLIQQIKWSFFQNDNNPLFYYEFLHFWVWIFGDSEFATRLPSALFGSFSIVAIFMVGKSLFNKNVGLLSAVILAVSEFHIKYSQEARAYSLLALLTLISFYFFLKLTRSNRRWYFVGYLISTILMLYTHYYGFFILAAQNIFFFANYLRSRSLGELSLKTWISSQIILGVLYLPGFFLFAKHTAAIQGGFWLPEPKLFGFVRTFMIYSGSVTLCIILAIFSLLAIFGHGKIKDKISQKKKSKSVDDNSDSDSLSNANRVYLLLLWLFVPICIALFNLSNIHTCFVFPLHYRSITGLLYIIGSRY